MEGVEIFNSDHTDRSTARVLNAVKFVESMYGCTVLAANKKESSNNTYTIFLRFKDKEGVKETTLKGISAGLI
jgi:hypothetical protein